MVLLVLSSLALLCSCCIQHVTCVSSPDAAATVAKFHVRAIIFKNDKRLLRDEDGDNYNDSHVGSITGLRLINSDVDLPIRSIANGTQYNVYNYPTLNLNIQADTNGTVGSVSLQYGNNIEKMYDGTGQKFHGGIDSTTPFSPCGDTNTSIIVPTSSSLSPSQGQNKTVNIIDYDTCPFLIREGLHTITATPYKYTNATGQNGQPYTVTFNVLNRPVAERNCKVPRVRDCCSKTITFCVINLGLHYTFYSHANCFAFLIYD